MKTLLFVLLLAGVSERPALAQPAIDGLETLDGTFSEPEREGARQLLHDEVSAVFVRSGDGFLRIVVQSEPIGVASLCVAGADDVLILHASAALGMLRYTRSDSAWTSKDRFSWAMRDTSMSVTALAERGAYLKEHGWVASTSRMGRPGETEFLVRRTILPEGDLFLAVGIMPLERPEEILGLPSPGAGDCAHERLVRGMAPRTDIRFNPQAWALVPDH